VPISHSLLPSQASNRLTWKEHIHGIAAVSSRKLGFFFGVWSYFSSISCWRYTRALSGSTWSTVLNIWAGAAECHLELLNKIQRRATRLVGYANLTSQLAPLDPRRRVVSLSLFYRYCHNVWKFKDVNDKYWNTVVNDKRQTKCCSMFKSVLIAEHALLVFLLNLLLSILAAGWSPYICFTDTSIVTVLTALLSWYHGRLKLAILWGIAPLGIPIECTSVVHALIPLKTLSKRDCPGIAIQQEGQQPYHDWPPEPGQDPSWSMNSGLSGSVGASQRSLPASPLAKKINKILINTNTLATKVDRMRCVFLWEYFLP